LQAEKDLNKLVKNAYTSVIGNHRACSIGTDDQLNIENKQQIDIGQDQTTTIGNDRTLHIGGNVLQVVKHSYTLSTQDAIVNTTEGRIDHHAKGEIVISSDTKITLKVGSSTIEITADNIKVQSGDRIDLNPYQGSKEYNDKKEAERKAGAQKAATDNFNKQAADPKKAAAYDSYAKAQAADAAAQKSGNPQDMMNASDQLKAAQAQGKDAGMTPADLQNMWHSQNPR